MGFHFLGFNKKQNSVHVYYQVCPSCKEPVVGIYGTQKLELMPPVTPDDKSSVITNVVKPSSKSLIQIF